MSVAAFDICGALPEGVTVLEASAGTGKTYTIAALAARYVAQGTPLDEMLLVTFTRMATGELRERVRERLVAVEAGLLRALAGVAEPGGDDEVVALLSRCAEDELRERCDNLAHALANFDAATIATTHGFCQEVLGGLGLAGDLAAGTVFVEDLSELLDDVVDDLYVRRFHGRETPPFDRAQALRIARAATDNPTAPIEPEDAPPGTQRAMRVRFAHAVRHELEARKQRGAVMTYDDLVGGLRAALSGPGGAVVAARLRARFSVVLVDEFQDTDPDQWAIMRDAFGAGGGTLVLIGDPKQAIYAFRGADVYAYLEAAATAGARETLAVNWRSDQPLLDAYDALFAGSRLGHEGIVYRSVRAAPRNERARLEGAPVTTPLRVRVARRDAPAAALTDKGFAAKDGALRHIARDLAHDLVALLSSEATVAPGDGARPPRREPIAPGHVAVLVRTNSTAALMRDALHEAGIPAVVSGAGSVFGTAAAGEWLDLLKAIERPASGPRARSAALTSFFGWSAADVACAGEGAWEEVHGRLHEWGRVLRSTGVASLTERITLTEGLQGRVLARADGERRLTDLRHIAQLVHGAATAEHLGTTALVSWLRQRIADVARDSGNEERSRRLESDDEAVQILTIHRSKGLEFPVVLCPDLWDGRRPTRGADWIAFHEPVHGDQRTIDVGAGGPDWQRHLTQHNAEQRGEDLRLAYVALTRARHQAVLWWAGSFDSRYSALARLLFARDEDAGSLRPQTPTDTAVVARLTELAEAVPGCIGVEVTAAPSGEVARWRRPRQAPAALTVATFGRGIDASWRRTSYSDITAGAHDPIVASEPEEGVVADEPLPGTAMPGPLAGDGRPTGREPGVGGAFGGEAGAVSAVGGEAGAVSAVGGEAGAVSAVGGEAGAVSAVGGEAGAVGAVGDEVGGDAGAADEAALRAVASRLAAMPVGVDVGTFVHRVLQAADFAAPDLDAELYGQVVELQARRRVEIGDPGLVAAGLAAALRTPLGPVFDGRALSDVARADRLDELEFELPLAGGEGARDGDGLEPAALGALLREHLPPGDPLAGYADRLCDPALRRGVRGYLTGSLDAVVRAGDRFAIVDYKTNWLAAPGETLSAWHHRPASLGAEIRRYHYGLQALLYTVALHRYLRWRLPGYDPDRNLAGVLYLFLRGMTGPDTPVLGDSPCGVFAWRPPGALVAALSDALDRGAPAGAPPRGATAGPPGSGGDAS